MGTSHGAPPILQFSCMAIFVQTDKLFFCTFFNNTTCDGTKIIIIYIYLDNDKINNKYKKKKKT
jgi:hypothetical protein